MAEIALSLTANEHATLVRVVEVALGESRVEARRTHLSPEFRQQVLAEESLLAGLLKKLREPAKCQAHD
jgi:hypothetical protein